MTLREKQSKFAVLAAKLILQAQAMGYQVTLGEALRTPEQAAINARRGTGTLTSLHISQLAIDLNLFRDGKWLKKSEDHLPLGKWWEGQDPDCRWGGRFKDHEGKAKPDGNHYSLQHEGRK